MTSSSRPRVPPKPKNLKASPFHDPQNTQAENSPRTAIVGPGSETILPDSTPEEQPLLPERPRVPATESISENPPREAGASRVFGIPVVTLPPGFPQANENVRNAFKDLVSKVRPPTAFAETKDDFDDLFRKSLGRKDLCSKCRSLPVEKCDGNPLGEADENEVHWATPLSRIIFHADWCRMCQLLLSMLVRPEFDPFKHPEVAPYLQENLQGTSMSQWVQKG
ncbi:hypothetical protein N7507_006651 [Penicillium longicatenatum]|nr:hypothetical protein N7507_006651 [Penicillium longicatenatum]